MNDEQPRDIGPAGRSDPDAALRRRPDRRASRGPQQTSPRSRSGDSLPNTGPTTPADVASSPLSHTDPGGPTGGPLQLYTAAAAAVMLAVPASWLRRKAADRLIPSTFVGKHLRFSRTDLTAIIAAGARPVISGRAPSRTRPRRN